MDPTAKGSMFQNPIFQMAINLHWFGRRERARSSYFSAEKKVPLQIIALVASAVQISFFVTLPMFNTDVYDMLD